MVNTIDFSLICLFVYNSSRKCSDTKITKTTQDKERNHSKGTIIPMSFHSDSFVGVERIGRGLGSRKVASVELK